MDQMVLPGKVCTKCSHWKAIDEFALDRRMRDGHRSACKSCMVVAQTARRLQDLEKYRAKDAAYRKANADLHRQRAREDYWNNRDRRMASRKARRHLHRAKRNEWNREWRRKNPELAAALGRLRGEARRARQRNNPAFRVTPKELLRIRAMPCAVAGCHNADIEADHVIPIARGGSHGVGNLQPLCGFHNRMKGAKLWIEFRVHLGNLARITG